MLPLLLTCLAVFLVNLDTTILFVAFPSIQESFSSATPSHLAWVLNGYTILYGSLLIPAGAYADQWGRRKFFAAGVAIFTVASALCGFSPNVTLLIAGRALQALGAALLMPSSIALVLAAVPKEKRAAAVGLWGATGALAGALGPSAGALLIQNFGWRSAFFLNVPFGLLALGLTYRFLTESRQPQMRIPSLAGSTLLGATLVFTCLALMSDSHGLAGSDWAWTAGALLSLAAFLALNQSSPNPAMDFSLLRDRTTLLANLGVMLLSVAFTSMFLGFVFFLGRVWHYSTVEAGLAITGGPLLALPAAILGGRYAAKKGHAGLLILGGIVFAAGMLLRIVWPANDHGYLTAWLPGMLLTGVGVGLILPSLIAAGSFHLPKDRYAMGSGITQTFRQIGGVVGVVLAIMMTGKGGAGFPALFDVTAFLGLLSGLCGLGIDTRPRPAASPAYASAEPPRPASLQKA